MGFNVMDKSLSSDLRYCFTVCNLFKNKCNFSFTFYELTKQKLETKLNVKPSPGPLQVGYVIKEI